MEEAGRQSVVGGKLVFHAWKRSVVSGKWVVRGWSGVWVQCANFLRQCSGSKESADLVAGSGRARKVVWHSGCSFPCFGQFYVLKRFSMSGNRWNGYALWLRTLLFLQAVREIDKNCVQCYNCTYVLSSTCLYAIFHMEKFSAHPVFSPKLIEGPRGPIFSNYRAPLVIITTNQLVANFVKVHQYFTRTTSLHFLRS